MLLSMQQRYILDLLRQLKCLRQEQVQRLVCRAYPPHDGHELPPNAVESMLRQLRYCTNDVFWEDGVVHLASSRPDALHLEAIDVMLELTDGRPESITIGKEPPVLLRFVLGGEHLRLFTVADLDSTLAQTLSAIPRQRLERIIWISGNGNMPERLSLPPKHFFAARQRDGSHRYFSGEGS